jgi:hypothetical protein
VHPVPILALGLLLVNDHILKPVHPGWLSGKLSDLAVLALLPFLLLASADLARMAFPRLPAPGLTAMLASVVVSMAVFVAIEVWPPGGDLYRWGLGAAQWPVRAIAALIDSHLVPGLAPVQLTSDVSDLVTLPAAGLVLLARRMVRG